jgi:WD40 repeat protein
VLAGTTGEMKGDVKSRLDRDIGKKVFQLRGAVSAANTLDIPSSRPDAKPLGLTGKFVYVQCRAVPTRPFCFHIDLLTTTNFGLRVSLSNIYKKVKTTGRTVQIPCFLDKGQRTKGKFTVVCLHLPSLIHDHFPPSHQYKCVKSFRLCSNLDVRGIFTSDTRYTLLDMPREMTFPVPRNQTWNARYVWMEMQPYPELGRVAIEQAAEDQDEPSAESSPVIVRHARLGGEGDAEGMDAMSVGAGDDAGEEKLGSREALTPGRGTGVRGSKVRHTSGRKVARSSPEREEPLMYLQSVLGYTMSMGMQHLCWLPDDKHIVYSNNNVVVLLDVQSGQQQFLFGHTGVVTAAVCSHLKDRPLLATVQEGPTPTVCLWDLAAWMGAHSKEAQQDPLETHSAAVEVPLLCTLSADFVSVCSLAFSSEHALRKGKLLLAVAGRDFRQRSLIVLWDLTQMDAVVPPTVHARQTSEFHVQRLLFSPYTSDPFNLVSCGNQSIRFWRIKNRCLPAHSLVLREYSKTCFTDLGFEPVYGVGDSQSKRIFVATKDGSVFQVNYEERVLECIYQLHDAPITSLAVNEGFCVTGSEDCYLRVWPLDFTDYYLQAKHKGAISCVQVSCDGLQIVAGTANGTVGVLDVASTVYRTRIRSHANGHAINAVAMDPQRAEFVTVSTDGTIRVWNLDSMEQVIHRPRAFLHFNIHMHTNTYTHTYTHVELSNAPLS